MNLEKVDYKIFEDMLITNGLISKDTITYNELESLYKRSPLFSFDVLSSITDFLKSNVALIDNKYTLFNILNELNLSEYFKDYCIFMETQFNHEDTLFLTDISCKGIDNNLKKQVTKYMSDTGGEIKYIGTVKVLFLNLTKHYIDAKTTGNERIFLPTNIALVEYIDILSKDEVLIQTVIEEIKNKYNIIIIPVLKDCDITNAYVLYKDAIIESLSRSTLDNRVYIDIMSIINNFTKTLSTTSLNNKEVINKDKPDIDNTNEQSTMITIIDYEADNVFSTTTFNLTKAHSLSYVLKMGFVEVPKPNGETIILAFKYSADRIDEKLYVIKYNNVMDSYLLLPFDNVTKINKASLKIKLPVGQEILARTINLQDVTSLHDRIVEINEYNKKHTEMMKQQGGFININNPIYGQRFQDPFHQGFFHGPQR